MKDRVTIVLYRPGIKYTEMDRQALPNGVQETEDAAKAYLTVHTIRTMVASKFGRGMDGGGIDGKDGRRWAKFLDFFLEEPLPLSIEVAREDFEWLRKIIADDDLKIPFVNMAQWRLAVERYFDELNSATKEEPAEAVVPMRGRMTA